MNETPGPAKSLSLLRRSLRSARRALILALVALAGLAGLWILAASSFAYSKGDRAGILQKFSERGWLCKTWEGELLLTGVPGVVPEKFEFSVRGDEVAGKVLAQVGRRVTLTYEQHKGMPGCLGETEYFVTGVQRLEP
jgi:hypothetical protein